MELICYVLDDDAVEIVPARNRRTWMNQTPDSYAYRCLPLSIANAHGWEMRCPVSIEATWNGGPGKHDIQVCALEGQDDRQCTAVDSHFGSGVLTFRTQVIIRTPPGYNLWVTGPINEFADGIAPLTAVIESDWIPYPFSMNWKFTRPGVKVRFEKGDSFCCFFPVPRGVVERCEPVMKSIADDPALEKLYQRASHQRNFLHAIQQFKGEGVQIKNEKEVRFQGWYMDGETPDGSGCGVEHQTRSHPRPFRRLPPRS